MCDNEVATIIDFMSMVQDILDDCESREEIETRTDQMIRSIKDMRKRELEFRKVMGRL